MARIVKEHVVRRNEILDVAQRLVYTKGYEQMTIQDMLDDLQISKGAFYHYFDSKQELLEALVERLGEEVVQLLLPIVHDPVLPALDKFRRYLATLNRWKIGQKAFILALLHVWFTDDNAIMRQKLRAAAIRDARVERFPIFINAPARVRSAPLTPTIPSCAERAANLLGADTNG